MLKGKIKKGAKNSVFEVKVFLFTLEGQFLQQRYDEITNSSYLATHLDNKSPSKFWSVDFGGYVYMYVTSDLNTSKEDVQGWINDRNILYFYSLSEKGFKLETVRDTNSFYDRMLIKLKIKKFRVLFDYLDESKDIGFIKKSSYEDDSKVFVVLDRRDDVRAHNLLKEVYLKELEAEVLMLQDKLNSHKAALNEGIKDEADEPIIPSPNQPIKTDKNVILTESIDPHYDDGFDEGDKSYKVIDVTKLSPEDDNPFTKFDIKTRIKKFFKNAFSPDIEVIDELPKHHRE